MAQLNGLPVYSINFKEDPSEDSGIGFVSLVDYPAIEANWVALSKEDSKKPLKFHFDADRQIIYGPILIPDKPIYRYDEKTGLEFYVTFPKDVVERLVRKLQKQGKAVNLNYQHLENSQIAEAVIQEIWLTGNPDKSSKWGFNLPEGSGFVGAYIGDSKFWNQEIKSGNVRGFSIEGFLDMEMKKILKEINMSAEKFITAKTDKGIEIKSDAEAFTTGVEVYTETDGQKKACETGDYVLENGSILKVTDGKVMEVVEAPEEALSESEIEIIQSAMKPVIERLKAELKSQKETYEAKIKELELKISNQPGAKSITDKTDDTKKIVTSKQKLSARLSLLRNKDKEVNQETK